MRTPSMEIDLHILKLISKSNRPLSTQDIAEQIKTAWHSIQSHCLRLQLDGKLSGFRIGRVNVWVKK